MAITDKFSNVGEPGSATYLANPGYSMGGTSINIQTYVGWPTGKIIFDMYTTKLVGNEEKAADNTRTSWQGIHNGSGTITSLQKLSGNDQNYTAGTGTRVIITHSTHWANQLVDGITAHANQDGSLKTAAVQSALNLGTQALNGWNPIGYTASFVQNNGNKETVVNYAGDVTQTLSPGMKVAYTRSVAPPTQCMSFTASSSQYATNASPTGITFTSAVTLESWIYVNSYSEGGIISATNATTSGFQFQIKPTGQLQIVAIQSSGVARNRITNQTIPLKKLVHVAVAVTMSTGVITFFVNGAPVTHISADAGSATAITQGGPLQLGAVNSSWFLDGLIAETRLWSTARTQAEILANMNNNLTGSESGLVGLWRGDNNFNDLTANANHLTATNGAIATQAANPFNLIEYGKITKVGAFSGGVTPVTVFTGTDCNIPNMALSSPLYSTQAAPYGFPSSSNKWRIEASFRTDFQITSTAGYAAVTGQQLSVPEGSWKITTEDTLASQANPSYGTVGYVTLSQSTTAEDDYRMTHYTAAVVASGANGLTISPATLCKDYSGPATTFYRLAKVNSTGAPTTILGAAAANIIYAELAY